MSATALYGLVILSAIVHPIWNAMVKSSGDRVLSMAAIRLAGLLIGLAVLPFVEWPAPETWKWLVLTAFVHFAYYALLIRSYGVGDMSIVYPLARGLAPTLTTIAAFLLIGEDLGYGKMLAVGLISLGIMTLSFGAGARLETVGFSVATGLCVASYSFLGGVGVRAAGTVLGFQACLEVVTGISMVGYTAVARRSRILAYARRHGAMGVLAGVISVLGFLAFLAAAKNLPLGPVVALRETSVIFGTVIGTVILKESFGLRRIAASASVVSGIALLAALR